MPISSSQQGGQPRIAIVGAGLVGRLLAISLKDDFQIDLFDQDDGQAQESAAVLAAAMLAPLAESADATKEIMALGELTLTLWPEVLRKLSQPVYFQHEGSLVVAFEQDLGNLRQFKSRLKGDDFEEVERVRIDELEPGINPRFKHGLFLPDEGQLDNRELLAALAQTIQESDITWHQHAFIEHDEQGYRHDGQYLQGYDWILDCRGVGAKSNQISSLDSEPTTTLRGVRGEVVRLHAPDVILNRPVRLMHPRYPIYITPKEDGIFVVGATQLESEDRREPTVRSALELLSACFSVHSGFAEAEILEIRSGLRPAYLDNEPKIFVQGNVLAINGLFRHGYLLAPAIVKQCLNIIKGDLKDSTITDLMPELVQQRESLS